MKLSKLTLEIIDLFAPEHSILRYQNKVICSDDNRKGGLFEQFENKEWSCKRCCLLDMMDNSTYFENSDYCPELSLEVYNWGTVR